MRLAKGLPFKNGAGDGPDAGDPREDETAEIIDLASRNGYSAVADRNSTSDGFALAGGLALVATIGALTFWAIEAAQLPEPSPEPQIAPPVASVPEPVIVPQIAPAPVVRPAPVPVASPQATGPATNPYASPTMVYDATRAAQAAQVAEPVTPAAPRAAGETSAGGSAAAFASRIGGVGGAPAQARPMVNPDTTVIEGTIIPAVLETAINTDIPGYVRAIVSQDVRSFDGTRVLVPRSSRLIGQYQSGVDQGQKRAYVVWTRLIRPDGASINIASPAIAFDGTTGLAGDVDTHFFSRIGSAMLLSVVGGLGALASGGTSVVITGAGQSAASTALQQDGERSPTIRVPPGEPIRVITARDLDFSTVTQ